MIKSILRKLIFLLCVVTFSLQLHAQERDALSLVRERLQHSAARYSLSQSDVAEVSIRADYVDRTTGIRHIYAGQHLEGLSVIGSSYSLHLKGETETENNHFLSLSKISIQPRSVRITAARAVEILMNDVRYPDEGKLTLKKSPQGIDQSQVFARNEHRIWDIPARLVYFKDKKQRALKVAWEVQMMDVYRSHYWVAYIDVATGTIIQKRDLIVHCSFQAPFVADKGSGQNQISVIEHQSTREPVDEPIALVAAGPADHFYRVYDMPFESPIDPGAVHSLVTNPGDPLGSPDGWHRTGGLVPYSYSRGNNVWAFQDPSPGPLGGVPSVDPTRTAYANNGVGGLPPLTPPYGFDYPLNLSNEPESYMKAAIVNLFYWNNLMHDVFYHFGFTEDAANFQNSPVFSTGTRSTRPSALLPDEVLAQAQDGGGTNNANFLTLPDGVNGQMQMYLWTAVSPDSMVQITSSGSGQPPSGAKFYAVQGSFNSLPGDINNLYTNPVVNKEFVIIESNPLSLVGEPTEGCGTGQESVPLPPGNVVADKIVIIDRGNCSFTEKVLGAQLGLAAGVIIVNNVDGPPIAMGGADAPGNAIVIPAVMISKEDGDLLKDQIRNGAVIVGSLKRDSPPLPKRDGDLDNGVISHEYAHGISSRLTGGGGELGSLGGDEQGGEGWSDFLALYMTMRNDDLLSPTAAHPNGVLPNRSIGNYVTYQPYDGAGIREYPYSTDMNVNPSTFEYIKKPEYSGPHSVGFVWGTMLYEMKQLFIDQYGMSDNVYNGANPVGNNPPASAKGNNIAMRLVIEGMKYQPLSPTFVQQRDAILKADTMLYNGQHSCMIWKSFAKRGLGYSAVSGTNSLGDETQSFDLPFTCDPSQKRIKVEKSGPIKVKKDGSIRYEITVINMFPAATTVTVYDTLSADLVLLSANPAGTQSGNVRSWEISLGAHDTATITIDGVVNTSATSTILFGDDHESGPGNWQAGSFPLGSSWEYRTDSAGAFSGKSYWFTPDVGTPGTNVSLSTNSSVRVNPGSELVFVHRYLAENNFDGGVVEVSTDGTNWSYLPPTSFSEGNYTGIIATLDNPFIGLNDLAAFTGNSSGYIVSIASLAEYEGEDIYIRFRFTADATGGSEEDGGWWIDDVYILQDRVEISNAVAAYTDVNGVLRESEGENAYAGTRAFVAGIESPVPVSITDFSGSVSGDRVMLQWKVSNERNVAHYTIERMKATEVQYRPVAQIRAKNNSLDLAYSHIDTDVRAGDLILYRLKITDADGVITYSHVISVRMTANQVLSLHIYPNPSSTVANLAINNPGGRPVKVKIFNVSGAKVAELRGGDGQSVNIALPVQFLAAGTYWVVVKTDRESVSGKLVIKK